MLNHYAVFGHPIEHSLSPRIHQLFAEQTGHSLVYDKIQIDLPLFEQRVIYFFEHGGKGLNITLPFKQRAFTMSNDVTARCLKARAANTLWYKAGQLYADNTDGIGLMRDLSRYIDIADKKILLLGSGGAARGILAPLLDANPAELTIANRSLDRAQNLQQDFSDVTHVCGFAELSGHYDVIINATSASLDDQVLPVPPTVMASATLCYDLAYRLNTLTSFVEQAQALGCLAVDGLGMLIEQAAEAFFIWHGVMPETQPIFGYFGRH
ncbi:shikimate dehydrogenase [bacterium]|nr:shikimate dehydrogenase [bacterium]